jgi:serine O-acetyltransferase
MDTSQFKADLYRWGGKTSVGQFLRVYAKHRTYRVVFWFRLAQLTKRWRFALSGLVIRRIYYAIAFRNGIDLPLSVEVGHGLIIWHGYGLVVDGGAVIGKNAMLAHDVTIGTERNMHATIGDQVRIAPGARIIGGVRIGDNAVVGANCVVTKDVPPNTAAVGVPNRNIGEYEEFANRFYWGIDPGGSKKEGDESTG